jgi:hypothetical protein
MGFLGSEVSEGTERNGGRDAEAGVRTEMAPPPLIFAQVLILKVVEVLWNEAVS